MKDKNAEDGTDLMAQDQSSESDGDVEGDGRESKVCEAKADGLSSMDVDWSEEKACIKCNMGGELLLCCGFGCPIALHGKCIPCNPRYDNTGKFYCPFCWYKLQLATAEELRKKALLAKKNLQDFMYCGPTEVDHGKEKQNDGSAKGNDSNVRLFVEERNKNEHLERMEQEKNNQVADEQDEEILEEEDHAGSVNVNTHCVEEEAIVDGALHKSAEVTAETTKASEGNQVREEEKEQIHRDLPETNVTCTGGDVALNVPEMCDSDAETVTVRVNSGRTPSERGGDQAREEKKEQIDGDAPESKVTCTGGDAAMDDPEMCDSDTETVTVRLNCGRKQSERRGDQVREEKEEQIYGDAQETNVTTGAGATLNAPEMWDSPTIARRMSCGEQTNNLSAESAESPRGSSLHPPVTVMDEAMKQKEEVGSVYMSEQSKVPAKK